VPRKIKEWSKLLGCPIKTEGKGWDDFNWLKTFRNDKIVHLKEAIFMLTPQEKARALNSFISGIAELMFVLHRELGLRMQSELIRSMYVPTVKSAI
jgi:hypothetical protein